MKAAENRVTGEVLVRPVQYLVTVWPECSHRRECFESELFCVLVTDRGDGWAVRRGVTPRLHEIVLTRSGRWETEKPGDPEYRFTLDEALALARRHATTINVSGRPLDIAALARKQLQRGCPE